MNLFSSRYYSVARLVSDVIKRREGGVKGLDLKSIGLDYSESLATPGCCYQRVHYLQDSKQAHVELLIPNGDPPPTDPGYQKYQKRTGQEDTH
jgi:hypothetical protein